MKTLMAFLMVVMLAGCTGRITPDNYKAATEACDGPTFGGLAWFDQTTKGAGWVTIDAICVNGQKVTLSLEQR